MRAFVAMVNRQLTESRWFLGIAAAALFGLSWLFVFAAGRIEARLRRATDPVEAMRGAGFVRALGGKSADMSSTSLEVAFWKHPFIILIVLSWAVSRGSASVAGEVERGTMDLVLSRPVSRSAYLAAQALAAIVGIVVLGAAMVAGNLVGSRFNTVESPPGLAALCLAASSLMVLAFSVFGYTALLSSVSSVRWLVTLAASFLTIAGFIAQVVANIPTLEAYKWLEKLSIFTAYDPVESALYAANLPFNAAVLGGIGLAGLVLGWIVFQYRDLPANA
jgi:ABC-2 type transport system permease protein